MGRFCLSFFAVTVLGCAVLSTSCSPDSACHEDTWIAVDLDADIHPDCTLYDVLKLRDDGVAMVISNAAVCRAPAGPILYLDSDDIPQRRYRVSGTDFVLLEDSHWYETRGTMFCGDDQMLTVEACPGTWSRALDPEGSAMADLFDLRCAEYWQACYNGFFAPRSCETDDDCPHSECDPGYGCEFPWD